MTPLTSIAKTDQIIYMLPFLPFPLCNLGYLYLAEKPLSHGYCMESPVNHYENNSLSHDVRSGSDITPCNKINKPLVVYRDFLKLCYDIHYKVV